MSVKFYQFGKLVGGTSSGGGSTAPADADFGPGEILAGTLVAGVNTLTFTQSLKHIRIANTHDSAAMDYSFDGVTWATLIAYQIVQEPASNQTIFLRPTVAGTFPTYELLGIQQG